MGNIRLPGIQTIVLEDKTAALPMRDGTPIEKNILVSEMKLIANEEHLREKFNIWSVQKCTISM